MGKGKDMVTKQKQVDDVYSYNSHGVETTLKTWTKVRNEQYYSTNYDLLDVFIDFEYALRDKSITPEERLVVAALYGLELNNIQVAKITGMKTLAIKKLSKSVIEKIVYILDVGFDSDNLNDWKPIKEASNVEEYLKYAAEGNYNLFDINNKVYNDVLHKMAKLDEVESKIILGLQEKEEEMEWEDQLKERVYTERQLDRQAETKNESDEYIDFATFQKTKYYSKRSAATQEYVNEYQEW